VPELRDVPAEFVTEPHLMPAEVEEEGRREEKGGDVEEERE
jgi:hypothetical protein